MKFTVDRSRWVHGGNRGGLTVGDARMLNALGNMCCLGHCAKQLGWSDAALLGKQYPEDVVTEREFTASNIFVDSESLLNSQLTERAVYINDDPDFTLADREKRLKKVFKDHDHEIAFKGKILR